MDPLLYEALGSREPTGILTPVSSQFQHCSSSVLFHLIQRKTTYSDMKRSCFRLLLFQFRWSASRKWKKMGGVGAFPSLETQPEG